MAGAITSVAVTPAAATTTASNDAAVPSSDTIVNGHARFEVLTPTLIRLEYAGDNHFQDGSTINVVNRNFGAPVPQSTSEQGGWLVITTSKLTLRYKEGSGPFTPANTSVTLAAAGKQVVAHPGWQSQPCVFGQLCEAEQAALSGGAKVASDHTGYTGAGFVAGYENVGASASFDVSGVPQAGSYALHVRYANYPANSADGGACAPRTLSVYVGGRDVGTATFDPTSSWDDWAEYQLPVTLATGANTIALTRDSDDCGNINIDSIAVTAAGQPMPAPTPTANLQALGGWRRSLDGQSSAAPLQPGLLDREGWYLLDDSQTALWTADGWAKPRPSHGGAAYQDGYFFGYGHDYQTALSEFAHLTGPAPLLPKSQFGFQYSRYYAYSAQDYEQTLIPKFRSEHVPLDDLYIDTDWKEPSSWNGWNWNTTLFPDPAKFLAWAKAQGIQVALNIHSSIQSDDPKFPEANQIAGGLVPNGGNNYVWDWSDPAQAKSYLWLHQPFEQQGVDFWWLDWCCDASFVSMKGLTPDTWINQLYAKDLTSKGKRGFVFSRMGSGLQTYTGSPVYPSGPWAAHRYDVHFTGDTFSTWPMLGFEASFTADEGASIGLPYVGDDLGGFHAQHESDDLYARWMQLGAFQPIMRVHSDHGDRLPWKYGPAAQASAEKFIRLREALVPYTYTAARVAHDSGLPIVRAMYLEYPDSPQAYDFNDEYMYGSQILVAPISTPGSVASRKVWFPEGTWIDYFTGAKITGPTVRTVTVPLDQMPLYVKAGGIVPEKPYMDHVDANPNAPTILKVYTGADGSYRLYDDAGTGLGYLNGQYAWTPITHTQNANGQQVLTIGAAQGSYPGQPATRQFQAQFVDASAPAQVRAGNRLLPEVKAGSTASGWWYDAAAHTVNVNLPATSTRQSVQVALEGAHVGNPAQPPVVGVTLQAPTLTAGQPSTVTATVTNYGPGALLGAIASLTTPAGWTAQPATASVGDVAEGASATATWQVTPAASSQPLSTATLTATVSYGYGSPVEQGSAKDVQSDIYVESPVSAPYQTFASTQPAYFGQSGDQLAIATDGDDLWLGLEDYATIYKAGAAGTQSTTVVKVDSQDDTNSWAKSGIMVRDDITKPGSSPGYAVIAVTPRNGVQMAWDANGDGQLESQAQAGVGTVVAPVWLKLTRDGSTFTGFYSTDGQTWHKVGTADVPNTQTNEDVGVFTVSHATGVVGKATFSGFKTTSP